MNAVGKGLFIVGIGLWASVTLAQALTCPDIVEAALDTTDENCQTTERNQACYGNISLEARDAANDQVGDFREPGNLTNLATVKTLTLDPLDETESTWGIALMLLQANLPDTLPGQNVTFLLFGDVEIENAVETNAEPISFTVIASSEADVWSSPSIEDEILGGLTANDTAVANGRTDDGAWLRVELADGSPGWVAAEIVTTDGDITTLDIVDPLALPAPALNPMQAFYFRSGVGDAPCAEAPDSGILVQTPEGVGQINFSVNEVDVSLGSTAYFQADPGGDMTISVLEGAAIVSATGVTVAVPAGNSVSIPLDNQRRASGPPSAPQPYNAAKTAVLPIRLLPRGITIALPISVTATPGSPGAGAILPAAGEWLWTTGTPSARGCPAGGVALAAAAFTPRGTFELPGDDFSLPILFGAAFGSGGPPPGAVMSQPEANTYTVEFTDGGGNGRYDVTVVSTSRIEGQLSYITSGCTMTLPFTVTLVGG